MIHNAIAEAYKQFESREWDRIYCAVDIHGTVADADYRGVSKELYQTGIGPLQVISNLPEVSFILFSCCYPNVYDKYFDLFRRNSIKIDYFNANPEVTNTATGCFDTKFYYNVIFEDKGGFAPWMWPSVRDAFMNARQFNKRVQKLYGDVPLKVHGGLDGAVGLAGSVRAMYEGGPSFRHALPDEFSP